MEHELANVGVRSFTERTVADCVNSAITISLVCHSRSRVEMEGADTILYKAFLCVL